MEKNERDQLIAQLLGQGLTLSQVQKQLEEEHGLKLTYMELRLISSALSVDWSKQDQAKQPRPPQPDLTEAAEEDELADEPLPAGAGRTTVTISKLVRPGAIFSGDVTFRSGAKAEWSVDRYGQLALNPTAGSSRPTQEDIQDFQVELQRQLQGQMGGG